ncbi:hypothetical protein [Algoriphagus sp. Y33]|uniref:hypothetical protein n=1 Tax=Algoriphagus sp. Y33 TaxID=2772483 RepID=UPI001781C350|nr:hypothetical protein [Algoriphagus sp. Y33]
MGTYRSFFLTGLLLGMFQLGLVAQSKDSIATAELSGAWLMDAALQMEKSMLANRNSQKALEDKHREDQLESMRSRMYIFYEDGQFESSWVSHGGSQIVYGKWDLGKDGVLLIELEDKSLLSYGITLERSRLQLTPGISGQSEAQTLYLKRFEP